MGLRLGKRPATADDRDFLARAVLSAAPPVPKAPARFGHATLFRDWGMLGNGPDDTVRPGFGGAGDCVFAGGDHETMLTNRLAGRHVAFTGASAIADYSAVTGYVVGDDSTDQGTNVRDALRYRQATGLVDATGARHLIGAYVAIDPKDWDLLMEAAWAFTAVGIGFEFPASAMQQFDSGEPWDVVAGSPIDGGHYVPVVARHNHDVGVAVSWARAQRFTRAFYEQYNDESWAIVFPEELRRGRNERGLDLSHLQDLLRQIGR